MRAANFGAQAIVPGEADHYREACRGGAAPGCKSRLFLARLFGLLLALEPQTQSLDSVVEQVFPRVQPSAVNDPANPPGIANID